jgi:hypothetical protein
LQEGFVDVRNRMSLGDRKSTNSASSSFDDEAPPPPIRHKVDPGKCLQGIRLRFPLLSSSNGSLDSIHRVKEKSLVPPKKSSMSSNDSTGHEFTEEQKGLNDSGRGFDDSAISLEETASPDSHAAIRIPRFNRVPSRLSSACSFGSVSGDELGIILSEEDELNKETGGLTKSFESGDGLASKESNDDIASRDVKVEDPTSKGGGKLKAKKRRKKSKDKDSLKCLIQ